MKFLAVVFAIILVVQLAYVTASKLPFNDLIETYGEQENLASEDMNSSLTRRNCKSFCLTYCKNRIADILSFADPIEAYEEQQNTQNDKLGITSEDMISLLGRRKCYSACLGWCK